MSRHPVYEIGQVLTFATFDHDDADTREMDGTKATVKVMHDDRQMVEVETIYGYREHDVYEFEEAL
jgi:regulator of RNase E activity RraA